MSSNRDNLRKYATGEPVLFVFEVVRHGSVPRDELIPSSMKDIETGLIIPMDMLPPYVPVVEVQPTIIKRGETEYVITTLLKPLQAIDYNTNEVIDISGIDHMWVSEKIGCAGEILSYWGVIKPYWDSKGQSFCFERTSSPGIAPMVFYPANDNGNLII